MVNEVSAYTTSDDQVFLRRIDALRHEAELALERLSLFQHGTIKALLDRVTEVAPILAAYADVVRSEFVEKETK